MALFKLLRGQESDLANQPLHDGYVWVTKDLQNMWFDYYDETNTLVRKRINSEYADKLRYVKDEETVELDPSEIATIDGTVKKSKQLDISDFGNYTNKTVGELQERINSWLENNLNVGAMFMAKGNWPTVWNNGSSSVISDGRTYTATVVATYQNTNYIQLMISTYGTKEIFFVVKEVGEWKNVVKNAFQDDIDTLLLSVDNKVDKVNGKGLSTNDYTTAEKNKLAGIADGANNYVLPSATDSVVGGMKLYTSTGSNTAGTMTQKAITDALAGKSGTGHNHDSVYSKLGHTHTAAEVGATTQTYVDNQIKDAKSYTDTKVAGLVDSAPETLNTLNELAAALGDDPNFATTMATELGNKATKTELNTHASSNIHITSTERTNWNAAKTHADSSHAPSNAERNIIVGIQKNGADVTVDSTTRKVNITVPTKTSELTNNSDFATNTSVASVKDELQANIDGKANSSHGNHVPTTQTASNKVFLRNDNTWATVTPANIGAAASSHTHSYLPLSGGTIDGRLSVHGYGNNGGLNLDGYQGRLELRAEIGTASIACVDGTNSASLIFSPNKPANEGIKFSMKKDSTLSLYKLYGEHNKPTASDIGAASTMSVTTAEYNTMSANNELQETTLYMLTDDTEEEDLQATVNEMNNIDYEANLAFDVNEIV